MSVLFFIFGAVFMVLFVGALVYEWLQEFDD